MNKKLIPMIIGLTLGGAATFAQADDLSQVYQLALTKDPQVLRAAAQVRSNKEGIVQAKAALYPNLSFTASAGKTKSEFYQNNSLLGDGSYIPVETDNNSTGYDFTLTQSIFDMRNWDSLDIADKRALQSEMNLQLTRQNLISRVAEAYFNVLRAQDDLELAEAEKKAIERQLEQTNQRFKVGLTAITDVHEARAQFDNSVATVIRNQNNVEIQKELLREITGSYHDELSALNTERFSTAKLQKTAEQWVNLARTSNNDLKVQNINVEIAKAEIDRAFSGHLPTLGMRVNYGKSDSQAISRTINGISSPDNEVTNQPPSNSKSISLNLTVPLFEGFATESAVNQAQANYVAASEDREQVHRQVVRTIRTNYANVSSLISTIKAQEQAQVSAESALTATEAGFEVGTRTIVDVLNSTQSLFNARRNLSSSRYDYIMAVLNLKLAAGTVNDSDISAINKGLSN